MVKCLSLLYQVTGQQPTHAPDLDDMVAPLLAELSKNDYGDVVSVVLDASDATMLAVAEDLRDAGARVRYTVRVMFFFVVVWGKK